MGSGTSEEPMSSFTVTPVMQQSATTRGNWWPIVGLALTLILTLATSLHTLTHLQRLIIALIMHGQPIRVSRLWVSLRPSDWALVGLDLAVLSLLVYLERAFQMFSALLGTASRLQCLVLLTVIVAWLGQAYLFPGVLLAGDAGSHITRFLEVRTGLAEGAFPLWSNYEYLGSSLLGFTGPLFYLVGGTVDLVFRDATVSTKVVLFTAHLAAGWAFYALLIRFGIDRIAAMLAAIGFAGSFALLHLFLYRGEYPQAFTIVLLVLTFYFAEGLMRGTGSLAVNWFLFALCVGGLTINHQPHALFAGAYLTLFGTTSLLLGRWKWRWLWYFVTAGVAGIGLSLPAVLPILAESDWVMIDPAGGFFHWHWPSGRRLLHLLFWWNSFTEGGTDYWAYVGIVLFGLALFGAIAVLRGRVGQDRRLLAASVAPGLVASLFLANPVVRDVMFIVFFLGILAGIGLEHAARAARPRSRVVLWLAIALIADVAGTSVQPVARTDKEFLIDAGRYLARIAPNERMAAMEIERNGTLHASIGPAGGPVTEYGLVQRVAGVHNMAATRVHNYGVTILEMAADELRRGGVLGEHTLSLLRLMNVTRIVCFTPTAAGCPQHFLGAREEGPLGRVIHLPDASPVVFSRRLVPLAPPPGLDKPMLWADSFDAGVPPQQVSETVDRLDDYIRKLGLARTGNMRAALPVRSLGSWTPDLPDDQPWHPRLTTYQVSLQSVSMEITSDGSGYAQLSHPWYPGNQLRVDGTVVQPLQGTLNLLVVPVHAGVNSIDIEPASTAIRHNSALAATLVFGITIGSALLMGIRERRQRRDRAWA